jgi:CheY-like chemotaxis protein
MTLFGTNVLLVGDDLRPASALANRLNQWTFRCHFASTIRAASEVLDSQSVDLVLCDTYLSDGTGFSLLRALTRIPITTAFLRVPIENGCLWLPAINRGKACLGLPVLRPSEFAKTLKQIARCLPAAPRVSKPVPKAEVA